MPGLGGEVVVWAEFYKSGHGEQRKVHELIADYTYTPTRCICVTPEIESE